MMATQAVVTRGARRRMSGVERHLEDIHISEDRSRGEI